MLGRECPRPLATLLFVMLALSFLWGQADSTKNRATPTPDFPFQPPTVQPPTVQPPTTQPPTVQPPTTQPPPRPVLPRPQVTTAIGLAQLSRAAGAIFSGTVTSITGSPAINANAVETVAITFHVENAIRGATPGTNFTFSQWIGSWSAGQRYRVGERVLLFLYPPSKLGLTSCVAAPVGRFNIDASGRMSLTAQQVAAFRADPVLGGRSRVTFRDFAQAVEQAGEEE
jgi:hypothetical protein